MSGEKAKKVMTAIIAVALAGVLAALVVTDILHKEPVETDKYSFAMGTVITQSVFSEKDESALCDEITDIISSLEDEISWRKENSDICSLNKTHSLRLSREMKDVFLKSSQMYVDSSGAFDITVGKVTTLWNIGEESARVPSEKEIRNALKYVDGSKVSISGDTVTIAENQFVELGAVGKGLACDRVRDYLRETDIKGAVISVGGSILLYGEKDKKGWNVAIRDPKGESSDYMAYLTLDEGCVSTSGDYERVLEKGGNKYHHIIDPKTGYPSESNLSSVTVVCESGFLSDALSTACFVLGRAEGEKLLEEYGAEGVFIDKKGIVFVTDGLKDLITLTSDAYVISGEVK